MRTRWGLLLFGIPLLLVPAAAIAQDLVTNGSFSTGSVSPWGGWMLVFDSQHDATGDGVGSGQSTIANGGSYGVFQPCITSVAPGQQFHFGGKVLFPAAGSGVADYRVQWFRNPSCDAGGNGFIGDVATTQPNAGSAPIDVWLALSATATAPPGTLSMLFVGDISTLQASPFSVNYDDIFLDKTCIRDANTACLLGGRYEVKVSYASNNNGSGAAQVMAFSGVRAEDDESVFLWFFDPSNFEIGLKILNGCAVDHHHWVFISGLTNQGWTVQVKDTQTTASATYSNPIGRLTPTTADTSSPLGCP